jgi:hypothetical protein
MVIVRVTMWLALLAWLASEWLALRPERFRLRQKLFAVSAILFVLHVLSAYQFAYAWNQNAALADVVRQTSAVTGVNWSGGLYVNYAFAVLWLGEAFWMGLHPEHFLRRPPWQTWLVRGVFWFMIVNGAVIFVLNPLRWLGLAICLGAVWIWWFEDRLQIVIQKNETSAE